MTTFQTIKIKPYPYKLLISFPKEIKKKKTPQNPASVKRKKTVHEKGLGNNRHSLVKNWSEETVEETMQQTRECELWKKRERSEQS